MVEQRVPVMAGHLYSFRFNFRADKLQVEKQTPGPGRGYSNIAVLIEWSGTGIAAPQRYTGALDNKVDSADWKQETNSSSHYQMIPQPYLAPCWSDGGHLSDSVSAPMPRTICRQCLLMMWNWSM